MTDIKNLKSQLTKRKPKLAVKGGLSTGSTLLNLACTDKTGIGFLPGNYYFLVGDSRSGKTWLSFTCLAEAALNPQFKDYRFIFDNAENGAMMDIEFFFGKQVASRLEVNVPETIEDFYFKMDDDIRQGKPFIRILDSMDALTAEDDEEKYEQRKKAHNTGKEITGSYGTAKAKANSAGLRRMVNGLRKTNSIAIIISQTRDNIGFGAKFDPKTRSGGKALRFFAHLEIWTSVKEKLKKTVRGKQRTIGAIIQAQIKKNRQTGSEPTVEIPFLHQHGIDDVGGCIRYLVEEKHWSETKGKITAPEFNFTGSIDNLVSKIESEELEAALKRVTQEVWDDIKQSSQVQRKSRYK